jgi:CopG antitoxin of type II toxin-antitoxin system
MCAKLGTPISGAKSYVEIGEYWDRQDLSDHWDQTRSAEFDVDLRGSSIYFPLERSLADQLRAAAEAHGVSSETLLNLWVQERVTSEPRSE